MSPGRTSRAAVLLLALLPGHSTSAPAPRDDGYLGVLFAQEGVDVSAEVAGVVREVHVGLGDRVEAQQVLVSLGSEDLGSEADQARAALETAKARVAQAQAGLDEVERLLERRRAAEEVFSREEVQAIETRRDVAKAECEAARSTVAERESTLRELERKVKALDVRAPFAGAVTVCRLDVGARVKAGESMVRLISADDLWVRFAVPSGESRWLRAGRAIRIVPDGDATAACGGEIRRVAPEIDPATDMVFVEGVVEAGGEGAPRLLAGEIVRVRATDGDGGEARP